MRLELRPDDVVERLALHLNLGPFPAATAMFSLATARLLEAGVTLGMFAELASHPKSAEELAEKLSLDRDATSLFLDGLRAVSVVDRRAGKYSLSRRAGRWLDPGSPTYVGTLIAFGRDQWTWWSSLEDAIRTGRGHPIHQRPRDDPMWSRYVTAMFELARIAAPEIARAIDLPHGAERLLDIGGGHGWYSVELCKRRPGLRATILDLPASAAIGRTILESRGWSDRVRHTDGDLHTADLGGHQAMLLVQVLRHLNHGEIDALLARIGSALPRGGALAIVDHFGSGDEHPGADTFVAINYFLTMGPARYSFDDLLAALDRTGFIVEKTRRIRRLPSQKLVVARTR